MRRELERAVEEVARRSVEPQRRQTAVEAVARPQQRLGRQPVHVRRQTTHVQVVVEVEVNRVARPTRPAAAVDLQRFTVVRAVSRLDYCDTAQLHHRQQPHHTRCSVCRSISGSVVRRMNEVSLR